MKVLFVRFSSLGDIVLITGVVKKFSNEFPEAEINVLTSNGFEDLFYKLDFINNVITFDRNSTFFDYIKFLQSNISDYDYIIDLHSNLRSKFIKFSTDATYISYKKDSLKRRLFVKFGIFKKDLNKPVIMKYYETLLKKFHIKIPEIEELRPVLFPYEINTNNKHIVIHPQASKYTKVWPNFKELSVKLLNMGYDITFVGAIRDEFDERAVNLTGKTNLKELIQTIASAGIVISTDSGPMHIATALNKKTIVIAGSTTKEFGFLPLFKNSKIIEVENIPCRPCHVHGMDICPKKHFKCMRDISTEIVLAAVDEFNRE